MSHFDITKYYPVGPTVPQKVLNLVIRLFEEITVDICDVWWFPLMTCQDIDVSLEIFGIYLDKDAKHLPRLRKVTSFMSLLKTSRDGRYTQEGPKVEREQVIASLVGGAHLIIILAKSKLGIDRQRLNDTLTPFNSWSQEAKDLGNELLGLIKPKLPLDSPLRSEHLDADLVRHFGNQIGANLIAPAAAELFKKTTKEKEQKLTTAAQIVGNKVRGRSGKVDFRHDEGGTEQVRVNQLPVLIGKQLVIDFAKAHQTAATMFIARHLDGIDRKDPKRLYSGIVISILAGRVCVQEIAEDHRKAKELEMESLGLVSRRYHKQFLSRYTRSRFALGA